MSVLSFLNWLQQTGWATGLKESALLFPLVEGTHILSLSFSVCMIMMLDFRLLGLSFRSQPASLMMDQLMQWALPGFCVMFFTGALLFCTEPVRAYGNNFFRAKMILLALAGINALFYRFRYYPKMAQWDLAAPPAGARAVAALSLIFWIGVIACGRTMAYEL
jgi:protein-S-isoprenylcysteine O-methyltransferase Ste14